MDAESDDAEVLNAFNHHRRDHITDPYPTLDKLRSKCPVEHMNALGGYYIATSFDTVKEVYSNFRSYTSSLGTGLPPSPIKMYPADVDPPEQTKYRKILNPLFTVEEVAKLAPAIEAQAHKAIDGFIEKGFADIADDYARPVIQTVVLPVLGIPSEDLAYISDLIEYFNHHRGDDMPGVIARTKQLEEHLLALIAKRRGEPHRDDVLGTLLRAEVDGSPLTDFRVYQVLMIVLLGALDTTTATVTGSLRHLAENPEDALKLKNGELSWDLAVEEFIRFTAPVLGIRRVTKTDTELAGVPIEAGASVLAMNAAGNRDPEHFVEPNRCMLDREDNDHLSFGAGAHICLGRHLARLETRILTEAFIDRIPDYRIADTFEPEFSTGEVRGMLKLPVLFTPGKRRAAPSA